MLRYETITGKKTSPCIITKLCFGTIQEPVFYVYGVRLKTITIIHDTIVAHRDFLVNAFYCPQKIRKKSAQCPFYSKKAYLSMVVGTARQIRFVYNREKNGKIFFALYKLILAKVSKTSDTSKSSVIHNNVDSSSRPFLS